MVISKAPGFSEMAQSKLRQAVGSGKFFSAISCEGEWYFDAGARVLQGVARFL